MLVVADGMNPETSFRSTSSPRLRLETLVDKDGSNQVELPRNSWLEHLKLVFPGMSRYPSLSQSAASATGWHLLRRPFPSTSPT
jgi:hypothetical protein